MKRTGADQRNHARKDWREVHVIPLLTARRLADVRARSNDAIGKVLIEI